MKLYIDGGCTNNNQKNLNLRKMVSVVSDDKGNILIEKENVGGSNNIAEFIALKEAMLYCAKNDIKNVDVITDSRNNTCWFKRLKRKKQNDFDRVADIKKEIDILKQIVKINLIWQPRAGNLAGQYIENKFNL